jgi:hypothetical protein
LTDLPVLFADEHAIMSAAPLQCSVSLRAHARTRGWRKFCFLA